MVYRDKKYLAWQKAAWAHYLEQRGLPSAYPRRGEVSGEFEVDISLSRLRKGADADNRIKAVLDILQKVGAIKNDSLCQSATVRKSLPGEDNPIGCRVVITPH